MRFTRSDNVALLKRAVLQWQTNPILPAKLFRPPKVAEPFTASAKHFHLTSIPGPATSRYRSLMPPGRNGFQPQLSLVYSTGNGNGPFGLDGASRSGREPKDLKRNSALSKRLWLRHEGDTFILSGAEDLVPVAETVGITRYRPRTEGLFARIEHHATPETDHWEVRSKDGLVQCLRNAVQLA